MMLMTDAPVELYDEVAIGPASTVDGEMLAHLDDVPGGAWLAVVLDRRSLSVTVGDSDTVHVTSALGQTGAIHPCDHRMTEGHQEHDDRASDPSVGDSP